MSDDLGSAAARDSGAVSGESVQYGYDDIREAFPEVDPGLEPFGSRILVQIKTPMSKTKGGILIPEESRDTEQWNTQVAKVISLGPLAFHSRDTQEPWPEGRWCSPGDFVRVPKYGGDRWEVRVPGTSDPALFVLFDDNDLVGRITCDPLDVVAFIR